MGSTQRITNVQTFCSNADFTKTRKPIETKMNTFLFMYMTSRDIVICYLELRKTRSVFPIPLEFEISKFACNTICLIPKFQAVVVQPSFCPTRSDTLKTSFPTMRLILPFICFRNACLWEMWQDVWVSVSRQTSPHLPYRGEKACL